jgi:hypothetical protein
VRLLQIDKKEMKCVEKKGSICTVGLSGKRGERERVRERESEGERETFLRPYSVKRLTKVLELILLELDILPVDVSHVVYNITECVCVGDESTRDGKERERERRDASSVCHLTVSPSLPLSFLLFSLSLVISSADVNSEAAYSCKGRA